MIFGNDGDSIMPVGNSYMTNDGAYTGIGSNLFGPDGASTLDLGNAVIGAGSSAAVCGNSITSSQGVYTLIGGVLFGPDGKTWSGVSSMEQAKDIVAMDVL
ncbi:MAG: hypothetical protein K6G90_08000 [Clostridia bacterium]|nr:hypothetical protein [Clostridia bacterium]